MTEVVGNTELPLERIRRGKVRDVYAVDAERLLLVASDRVSAFDVVMDELVPFKGAVLTQITAWWLRQFEGKLAHHMLSSDVDDIVRAVPGIAAFRDQLVGRTMLCRRAEVIPVECVVRGYLAGSAWKEYRQTGTLAGEPLAAGLIESDRFEPPVFSPATKADVGHDENITIAHMRAELGERTATELERLSRMIYSEGREVAAGRGIIIADTKFEFGTVGDEIILIDEVLTPDSSRFWPADRYAPGGSQPSFDKQPLRDYLEGEKREGRWNGNAPPPTLPAEVIEATSVRYRNAYRLLTGSTLPVPGA
ncbi:MAG: phosphoribosylaminoimidazolesuccinocarboxamide synthase [Gemmatimonadetes bacterium]|nr:phosphoribosylaminoimidazolesuccinocarboxamide synthase [Gemmatimonadota bacterium]